MRHFPASRYTPRLEGVTVSHAPRPFSASFLILVGGTLFAAGFITAVWTVGIIVTAR